MTDQNVQVGWLWRSMNATSYDLEQLDDDACIEEASNGHPLIVPVFVSRADADRLGLVLGQEKDASL